MFCEQRQTCVLEIVILVRPTKVVNKIFIIIIIIIISGFKMLYCLCTVH